MTAPRSDGIPAEQMTQAYFDQFSRWQKTGPEFSQAGWVTVTRGECDMASVTVGVGQRWRPVLTGGGL